MTSFQWIEGKREEGGCICFRPAIVHILFLIYLAGLCRIWLKDLLPTQPSSPRLVYTFIF